nr:phospholipase A [Candidatus Hamiltonella defensa]
MTYYPKSIFKPIAYSIICFVTGAFSLCDAQELTSAEMSDKEVKKKGIVANLLHDEGNIFHLYSYEKNFLLYTFTNHINKKAISKYSWAEKAKKNELLFQFSVGFPIWKGIIGDNSLLGASYTQRSWWQMLNIQESSPFRETNYEPQLFLGWATHYKLAGWVLRDIQIGINHQSNGRSQETSRSWNRVFLKLMAQNGKWKIDVMPWLRVGKIEDNPDISKYMGYYSLKTSYKLEANEISVETRYNWNSGYGGVNVGWSHNISSNLALYTQLFSGYGESLIDYNHRQTRFGIGFTLKI